jgi:hypothetical protein
LFVKESAVTAQVSSIIVWWKAFFRLAKNQPFYERERKRRKGM